MTTTFHWTLLNTRSHLMPSPPVPVGIPHGVTDTPPGDDILGVAGIILDLFPEPANGDIHGANITEVIVSPDRLQQVLPGQNLVDVFGQVEEQLKFPMG